MELSAEAQTYEVQVVTDLSWATLVEETPWVRLSQTNGTGDTALTITLDANYSEDARSVQLLIGGETHVIDQAGKQPYLAPIELRAMGGNRLELATPTSPGRNYRLYVSESLLPGCWAPVGPAFPGTGEIVRQEVSAAHRASYYRYRVR